MAPPPNPSSAKPSPSTRQPQWIASALFVVFLAVLVQAAIPNFGGGPRRGANASAAIATLKNIHSAQCQVHAAVAIDCNGDNRGEYATIAELAGAVPMRSRDGIGAGKTLVPAVLSQAFGKLQNGCVHRSGYVFQMFLPGTGGVWLPESHSGGPLAGIDPVRASSDWICYAWPLHSDETGSRVFVIDSHGNLLAADQGRHGYEGSRAPTAGVAGRTFADGTWGAAANSLDVLGDCWVVVN